VFTMCTSSFDLHMLIVPFRYLFSTLLVPKVATGNYLSGDNKFAKFTMTTLKAFLKVRNQSVSGNKQ